MAADLYPEQAPDDEDFIVCWLAPLMRSATERKTGDPLPFALVQHVTGEDCPDEGTDDGVIQIDFFDKARNGFTAVQNAKHTARQGHRRMLYLARHLPYVEVSDGSEVAADYVSTLMKPTRMDSVDESVARFVARYAVGLSYVTDEYEGS
jgi:hypothetical protein